MHCLNLKITYRCTNQCSFCFSSYLKDEQISEEGLLSAIKRGREQGCNELVLSGGEPSVRPNVLCHTIEFAQNIGYSKFIIQSNGSGIATNQNLVKFLQNMSSSNDIVISFSVHGHNAEIHNKMSCSNGAFERLIKAMNIVKDQTECGIYTNTVISSLNILHLRDIAVMLNPFEPEIMQFAMMHLKEKSELSTGLVETAAAVRALKDIVSVEVLRTEGIPYCLLYGLEQCVGESYWPNQLDLYNRDAEYMRDFRQLDYGMRWKRADCHACIMNEVCMGIWQEHASEFEQSNVRPIC